MKMSLICMKKNLEAEIVLTRFDAEAKGNEEMASNRKSYERFRSTYFVSSYEALLIIAYRN